MKRAVNRKSSAPSLGAWVPNELLAVLDQAVEAAGTNRSKFVRGALQEKVARTKISVAPVDEKA